MRTALLAWLLLALPGTPAARDHARDAQRAAADRLPAVSVFVDVDWGGREDGAARALTRAHAAYAAHGYDVVDVEGYLENGDLQGFFVTYRKRAPDLAGARPR